MIRICHINHPELKAKVLAKLAEWRGMPVSAIPEWFELDDADYSDLLIEIRADEEDPGRRRRPGPTVRRP
ncbi:MAG TPA: hypothetical protein VF624_08095 [Tepidisphaeraceae bacterium]